MNQFVIPQEEFPDNRSRLRQHTPPHCRRVTVNTLELWEPYRSRVPTDSRSKKNNSSGGKKILRTLEHFPAGMFSVRSKRSSRTSKSTFIPAQSHMFNLDIQFPQKKQNVKRPSVQPRVFTTVPRKLRSNKSSLQNTLPVTLQTIEQPKISIVEYFTEYGDYSSTRFKEQSTIRAKPFISSIVRQKLRSQQRRQNSRKQQSIKETTNRTTFVNKFLQLI